MFKKKNPYLIEETVKPVEYLSKNFMLSPKNINTGNIVNAPEPAY